MGKCKILVVTHKEFDDSIVPKGYQIVKVGKKIDDELALNRGYCVDSIGDNISNQNPWYCELTAQYWGWKNLSSSEAHYIGVTHYRRYFFDYKKNTKQFFEDILTEERIAEILEKYKVIMSFETVKIPGYGSLYRNKSLEEQDKHWVIMKEIFSRDYPELMPSFEKIMYGKYAIWGNMFVTTKEVYDEYSSWLFEVLHKYDMEIEKLCEQRIPRVDGFLAEYLLLVWFYNKFSQRDIYRLEVRNIEEDGFVDYTNSARGRVIKFIRKHRGMLLFARKVRIGYLLVKRRDTQR